MAARHLGAFGEDQRNADDVETFTYFGQTFGLHEEFGPIVFTDWVEEFGSLDDTDPRSVLAIKAFVRLVVRPDEFDSFWALAKRHRQSVEQIMEMAKGLLEALTGRPTSRSSDSSDGPPSTDGSSTAGSSSPVVRRYEQRGRPDLALIVQEAQMAQEARAS